MGGGFSFQRGIRLRHEAPKRRHSGHARDLFPLKRFDDFARKNKGHRNISTALLNRGHELVEAGIEAQRQNANNAVSRCNPK